MLCELYDYVSVAAFRKNGETSEVRTSRRVPPQSLEALTEQPAGGLAVPLRERSTVRTTEGGQS